MKILTRNDPCWCKSGKKYKQCHMENDERLRALQIQGYKIPPRRLILNEAQISGIAESGKITSGILDELTEIVKAGVSTAQINEFIHKNTLLRGGTPATLNYEIPGSPPYPRSCCISINDVVCHGIADEQTILKDGDIVNVDMTTIFGGYFSDSSRMYTIGEISDEAAKLVRVAKECMEVGISAVEPFKSIENIGAAVEAHAKANGFSVVRALGGHGVGLQFHEDPHIHHYKTGAKAMIMYPGMVFTVEPMINQGKFDVTTDEEDGWTVRTKDGRLSAQWEHTVAVTETGVKILC